MILVGDLHCLQQLSNLKTFLSIFVDLILPDNFFRFLFGPFVNKGQHLKISVDDLAVLIMNLLVIDGVFFNMADNVYIVYYFLLDFLVPTNTFFLIRTIFEEKVSVSFLFEIELILVVSAFLVLVGLVIDGLFILNKRGGGRAVLLRVTLEEYGVYQWRIQPP